MGGITLTLKPKEKFLIGGNLIENGPRRTSIRITEGVFVLRVSDALHPDDVKTPITRAYHVAQLILACEVREFDGKAELLSRLDQLSAIFAKTVHREAIDNAIEAAECGRYHRVLIALKGLFPIEAELLKVCASPATNGGELVEDRRVAVGR